MGQAQNKAGVWAAPEHCLLSLPVPFLLLQLLRDEVFVDSLLGQYQNKARPCLARNLALVWINTHMAQLCVQLL